MQYESIMSNLTKQRTKTFKLGRKWTFSNKALSSSQNNFAGNVPERKLKWMKNSLKMNCPPRVPSKVAWT